MAIGIDISVPKLYADAVDAFFSGERVSVETAWLNARTSEVAFAIALHRAGAGDGDVVLFSPSISLIKMLVTRWLGDIKIKKSSMTSGQCSVLCLDFVETGETVWVVEGESFTLRDLPFTTPAALISTDSHGVETNIADLFPRTPLIALGQFAEKRSWFYHYGRKEETTLLRFTMDDIVNQFPDQSRYVLEEDDPNYQRNMLLEDVGLNLAAVSFVDFASKRLFIKSDKPAEFLSKRQQEHAKDQVGKFRVVPFDINDLQKVFVAKKEEYIQKGKKPWFIVVKYRRGGITTMEQAASYMVAATQPMSDVVTLAHNLPSTQRIFRMVSGFQEFDPSAPRLVGDSKTQLSFENGSNFFIGTAGGRGFLRGDGCARVHGSEVSKWCPGPNQFALVEDLIAGIQGAASHGEITLETTPNGRDWLYHAYQDGKKGLNDFNPIFLRWFDDPINRAVDGSYDPDEIRDTLDAKEIELIEMHGLDMAQVAFRREQVRVYRRLFAQEMPEDDTTCFITSGTCYFDIDKVLNLAERTPEPTASQKRSHPGGYEIRWKEPEPGRRYVVGVDTSEGLPGCDRNGVGVLDRETGEQVCSLHGLFNPRLLADHAVRIATDYNKALLGIERENHGHAVLLRVQDLGYGKPHFRGGPLFYCDENKSDVRKSRPGWKTTGNRDMMLDALAEAVEDDLMKINDRDFIDEMGSFRLQSNGKFEADSGAHDDSVMKWAIAWQMKKLRIRKPSITIVGS